MLTAMRVFASRLLGSFRRRRFDAGIEEEFQSHLQMLADRFVSQGMTKAEALRAAKQQFGGVAQVEEELRERSGLAFLDSLWQDLCYGLCMLRRSPGFTAVAVLTLALGIGANTAIFSIVDAVMLRFLPVRNPKQLVLLNRTGGLNVVQSDNGSPNAEPFSYPTFEAIRAHNHVFSEVFGFVPLDVPGYEKANVNISGQASLAEAELVTGDYFSGLGVSPIIGRIIGPQDEKAEAPRTAVISYGYWSRRFGHNSAALGTTIVIDGVPFTIVGVTPPLFFGVQPGRAVDVWVPLRDDPKLLPYGMTAAPGSGDPFSSRDWWWLMIMGRLKSGVTTQQAAAQVEVLFQQSIAGSFKEKPKVPPHIKIESGQQGLANLQQQFSKPLWILMVVVGMVALIACANIAGLLIARSQTREREIALRLSLGASQRRVVRQLLTESVLLASVGGLLGLLLAYWGSRALLLLMSSGGHALNLALQLNPEVLAFTAGVSVLTAILFGLAPALRSARTDLNSALKEAPGARPSSSRLKRSRAGSLLAISQVALSLLLLVGAGLFVRTLQNLANQNLGFNQHDLLLFAVDPAKEGYKGQALIDFYERLLRHLQVLPGVRSATASEEPLLSGMQDSWDVSIEGLKSKPGQIEWNNVGPSFFETMGIPLLAGRGIQWQDTASSLKAVVVNDAFARQFLDGRSPIGYKITFKNFLSKGPDFSYEIVGMVRDAKYASLRRAPQPTVYAPFSQAPFPMWMLHYEIRTAGNPTTIVPAVRDVVHSLDSNVPLSEVKTQTEQIAESSMQERMFAQVTSFFSALAALLSCIGLYGLIAYSVARRTHELGVRMALGAQREDVLRMVIRQGMLLAGIGIIVGIGGALALTRFLRSMLFEIKPTDPTTFVGVAILLALVALLASYIPARRAMRVDPMVALRYE
ncbi:MAG TPA: ABC transporter permease [Candidatus Sulfotelmatobacter sp.]|nr:ABC transporter permease [Candidatus Sulfotelmatobacter sp.]